jgi:hypothetical protein
MRKTLLFCFILLLFSNGCIFRRKVTHDNLRSSTEAQGISSRSESISTSARTLELEAAQGRLEVGRDLRTGDISPSSASSNSSRYERMGREAKLIERLAELNRKSSGRIVDINTGTWYTTWTFKLIIGCIIGIVILFLISYITFILRSWGVLSYIRNMNEGIADGMADMINTNEKINNYDTHDEIHRRIKNRLRKP